MNPSTSKTELPLSTQIRKKVFGSSLFAKLVLRTGAPICGSASFVTTCPNKPNQRWALRSHAVNTWGSRSVGDEMLVARANGRFVLAPAA